MAGPGKKRKPIRGKSTYFPRVRRTVIDYPGGQIEIVKERKGRHRYIAPEEVKITETLDTKPPPVV